VGFRLGYSPRKKKSWRNIILENELHPTVKRLFKSHETVVRKVRSIKIKSFWIIFQKVLIVDEFLEHKFSK